MTLSTTTEAISSAQKILAFAERDNEMANAILDEVPFTKKLNSFSQLNILRTAKVAKDWRRIGRQVLCIHPEIVEEVKVASSDKVPGEVLRALPYINPLVIFAEPPEFKSWVTAGKLDTPTDFVNQTMEYDRPEDKMRLLGYFTYGKGHLTRDEADQLNSGKLTPQNAAAEVRLSNDPEAGYLGVMLLFEILDDRGKVIDYEINAISIPFGVTQTLSESVDDLLGRFHWGSPKARQHPSTRKWMREVLSITMGSLFYLCSTTLEAEKVPTRATKHLAKGFARKPLSFYRVGWTMGAALTRYRQSRRPAWRESEQSDLGHQQDPQHRKAYFGIRWCGPGRTIPRLTLVSAYWTHVERLGEVGVNTAHAVPRVGPQGDAQDSVHTALGVMKE